MTIIQSALTWLKKRNKSHNSATPVTHCSRATLWDENKLVPTREVWPSVYKDGEMKCAQKLGWPKMFSQQWQEECFTNVPTHVSVASILPSLIYELQSDASYFSQNNWPILNRRVVQIVVFLSYFVMNFVQFLPYFSLETAGCCWPIWNRRLARR